MGLHRRWRHTVLCGDLFGLLLGDWLLPALFAALGRRLHQGLHYLFAFRLLFATCVYFYHLLASISVYACSSSGPSTIPPPSRSAMRKSLPSDWRGNAPPPPRGLMKAMGRAFSALKKERSSWCIIRPHASTDPTTYGRRCASSMGS